MTQPIELERRRGDDSCISKRRTPIQPRARRRVGTIALVYGIHVGIALAIAWPLAGLFTAGAQRLALGDAALFEPGSLYLLEAVRQNAQPVLRAAPGTLWLVCTSSYLGLLPLGALVHAINRRGRVGLAELASAGGRYLGRYSLLWGLALLAIVFCSAFVGLTMAVIPHHTALGLVAMTALGTVASVLIAGLGIAHDLARAAVVRCRMSVARALETAGRTFVRCPLRAALGWLWRAAAGAAIVAGSAFLSSRLSRQTTASLLVTVVIHQVVIVSLIALRASWLACALRLVATTSSSTRDSGSDHLAGQETQVLAVNER